jgi:hypothetical protein
MPLTLMPLKLTSNLLVMDSTASKLVTMAQVSQRMILKLLQNEVQLPRLVSLKTFLKSKV